MATATATSQARATVDAIRLWVGDANTRHSAIYRIWPYSSRGDLYLAVRSLAGVFKLSVHGPDADKGFDGLDCQCGLTDGSWSKLQVEGHAVGNRKPFHRWRRSPTPDSGWVPVAKLILPTDLLRARVPVSEKKKCACIPPAPIGHAFELGIFYTREKDDGIARLIPGWNRLYDVELASGDTALICGHYTIFNSSPFRRPQVLPGDKVRVRKLRQGEKVENCSSLRFSAPKDGQAIVLMETSGITVRQS